MGQPGFEQLKLSFNLNPTLKFPVLLFDGVCNLCNTSVQWVLQRDRKGQFRFAALQSDTGRELLARHGLDPAAFDSVVLVDAHRVYLRSDAALEVARKIGLPWSLLTVFFIVPRFIRNAVYNFIARNRYRWFGKREACLFMLPEWRGRFLD